MRPWTVAFAVLLFAFSLAAQTKKAAPEETDDAQKLSANFLKPAQRALDAVNADNLTIEPMSATPTTDRIDAAAAVAASDGDRGFVKALRSYNDDKVMLNIWTSMKKLNYELETKLAVLEGKEFHDTDEKFEQAVKDKMTADRDLQIFVAAAEDCSDALAEMLKVQKYSGSIPAKCRFSKAKEK